MDFTGGLAAASQALDALKAWRAIEKGIGDAGTPFFTASESSA